MKFTLNAEGQKLYDKFVWEYEGVGCTCFQSAPCGHCIHPGNPDNLAECPEYHESSED